MWRATYVDVVGQSGHVSDALERGDEGASTRLDLHVCVSVRVTESVSVYVYVYVCDRESVSESASMCVAERENVSV